MPHALTPSTDLLLVAESIFEAGAKLARNREPRSSTSAYAVGTPLTPHRLARCSLVPATLGALLLSLGIPSAHGQGEPQHDEAAVVQLRNAADQGHANAQFELGFTHLNLNDEGAPEEMSLERLESLVSASRSSSDPEATPDYAEAALWFRKAADQGHVKGQMLLAFLYLIGAGVPQDSPEAVTWYRKAAEQGDVEAQMKLGAIYTYLSIIPGLRQDYRQAVTWYRLAADQGHTEAQIRLGDIFRAGEGLPQDYAEAAIWYRKAADQGDQGAQAWLGRLYHSGAGVPQDHAEAATWYRKAADQGHPEAQLALGWMSARGEGVPQDYGQAAAWYRKVAEREGLKSSLIYDRAVRVAQFNLGFSYANGMGAPQDYVRAYAWWDLASAPPPAWWGRGFRRPIKKIMKQAKKAMKRIEKRMTPAQIAEAQTLGFESLTNDK